LQSEIRTLKIMESVISKEYLESLEKERDSLFGKLEELEHELMRANVRIDELEDWVEDLQQRIAF
jgi:predicted  nucleic acid-binding Zn-ribbon protein